MNGHTRLPDAMQALVWTAPGRMEMQTLPAPAPGPAEVLLEVAAVGICGSELSGYLGHNSLRVPPLIMGHEFSARAWRRSAAVRWPTVLRRRLVSAWWSIP